MAIDDITFLFPPELLIAFDVEATSKAVGWVQARLLKEDETLNQSKSKVLLPGGVEAGDLSADQRADLKRTELAAAGRGMRMIEVTMGKYEHEMGFCC